MESLYLGIIAGVAIGSAVSYKARSYGKLAYSYGRSRAIKSTLLQPEKISEQIRESEYQAGLREVKTLEELANFLGSVEEGFLEKIKRIAPKDARPFFATLFRTGSENNRKKLQIYATHNRGDAVHIKGIDWNQVERLGPVYGEIMLDLKLHRRLTEKSRYRELRLFSEKLFEHNAFKILLRLRQQGTETKLIRALFENHPLRKYANMGLEELLRYFEEKGMKEEVASYRYSGDLSHIERALDRNLLHFVKSIRGTLGIANLLEIYLMKRNEIRNIRQAVRREL